MHLIVNKTTIIYITQLFQRATFTVYIVYNQRVLNKTKFSTVMSI